MLKNFFKDKEIKEIKQTINIINQNNKNNNTDFDIIKSSIEIIRTNIELLKSDKLDDIELYQNIINDIYKIDKDLKNIKKNFINYNRKLSKYIELENNKKKLIQNEMDVLKINNKILNEKFDVLFEMVKNNKVNNTLIKTELEIKEITHKEIITKKIKKPFVC